MRYRSLAKIVPLKRTRFGVTEEMMRADIVSNRSIHRRQKPTLHLQTDCSPCTEQHTLDTEERARRDVSLSPFNTCGQSTLTLTLTNSAVTYTVLELLPESFSLAYPPAAMHGREVLPRSLFFKLSPNPPPEPRTRGRVRHTHNSQKTLFYRSHLIS